MKITTQIEQLLLNQRISTVIGGSTTFASIVTYLSEKIMPVVTLVGVCAGTLLTLLNLVVFIRNEYRNRSKGK